MMTSTACASTAMEHTVDESVVADLRNDENDAPVPRVNAGRQIPRNEIAERDAQPVEDANYGCRIVDSERERTHGHFDELADGELEIVRAGASGIDGRILRDRLSDAVDMGFR